MRVDYLDSLDQAVTQLLAQEETRQTNVRLKHELQTSMEPFVWAAVDCEPVADLLPAEIRSGWIFVLKRDTASGAHHHPNSIQHMVVIEGVGQSVVGGREREMIRHGAPGKRPDDIWYVIDRNVNHEFFPRGTDMVVISFHTCAADELLEVDSSGHSRRYETSPQ